MKLKTKTSQNTSTDQTEITTSSLEVNSITEETDPTKKKSYIVMQKLLASLKEVKTDTKEAEQNAESMDDNNGDRIIYTLTEDMIKKRGY